MNKPTEAPQAGIHLVHKPIGASSFSLVRAFQDEVRRAGIRPDKLPACHGGALDPFAEGLVLVLAGKATRLMEHLHAVPKLYAAEIAWGVETDNGDPLGKPVLRGDPSTLSAAALAAALAGLIGFHDQVPPATSNKRVGGERAYEKAWRGEEVVLPPSPVYLHAARFVSHDLPRSSRVELACRGGFYVRSLARDLGRVLGCGAHLTALHRTAIGPWLDPGPGGRALIKGAALLPWLAAREVTEVEARRLEAGQPIAPGPLRAPDWPLPTGFPGSPLVRALLGDRLVALLASEPGALRREVGLGL